MSTHRMQDVVDRVRRQTNRLIRFSVTVHRFNKIQRRIFRSCLLLKLGVRCHEHNWVVSHKVNHKYFIHTIKTIVIIANQSFNNLLNNKNAALVNFPKVQTSQYTSKR